MENNLFFDRICQLRKIMETRMWDAVIISGSDPHASEYPAPRWKQVEWISGFTGEAGDVVITTDHAGLWTDTRYFIQANEQLKGTGIELHKTRIPGEVLIPEWLSSTFRGERTVVAVDGLCQSISNIESIKKAFEKEDREIIIVSVPDMLDMIWTDRPDIPQTPLINLPDESVGESSDEKIERVRRFLRERNCEAMLVSSLDEIAWLYNVRASDIDYNPYVISYLIVSLEDEKWFLHDNYDDICLALGEYEGRIFIEPSSTSYHIYSMLNPERTTMGSSPIALMKAVKNNVEIEGIRQTHILDGVAMEKFLYWLENEVPYGVSEWDAANKLLELRSGIEGFQGESFETISAYGKGAALPHYITPRENAPLLENHGLYLVDSGGQYISGTTDITRTVPLGQCSDLEKEDYTLVLKGHIDLAKAIFPKGTAGCQIDSLAREPLWSHLRNFGHGTGHGVGCFLGVHEGPQDIRQNFNRQPLLPGMVTSDEPGIYREGMFGVRHENLLLCKELENNEFGEWLCFETLTLCHFDTSIVDRSLLDFSEIEWLNGYNRTVYEKLSPMLPPEISLWLKEKTAAI